MDYGIKVSEPGYDVKNAEDKNLSLKSGFTLLKVFAQGSVDIVGQNKDITHNLGYQPQFLAFVFNDPSTWRPQADTTAHLATGLSDVGYVYTTNSILSLNSPAGTDLKAYYYIFYEQLSTGTSPTTTSTNNYGIKISKDGVDVKSANILEQTFNSEKNSLKIMEQGTRSGTVNTSAVFLISHTLDFVPGYLVYFQVNGSGKWWSAYEKDTLSTKNVVVNAYTTENLLVVEADSSASCTVKIKYYLLADPAQ